MRYTACLLLVTVVSGCAQQMSDPARPALEMQVVNQAGRIVFPVEVDRPTKLNWKATTNGLELATWSMPDWPFVFCAVRNPTEKPIKYPGGCGLGWWEFTSILGRKQGSAEWTHIPIRPASPYGTRVITGIGPIPMDLAPGQEYHMGIRSGLGGAPVSLVERNYSFYVDLNEYSIPETLSGPIEIKILSLGFEFPNATLSMDAIQKRTTR